MFAICVDEPERLEELQDELGRGVTLVADTLGTATKAFGMVDELGFPKRLLARAGTFLVDHEGIVRRRWLTTSYRLRPDADEVLAALKTQ